MDQLVYRLLGAKCEDVRPIVVGQQAFVRGPLRRTYSVERLPVRRKHCVGYRAIDPIIWVFNAGADQIDIIVRGIDQGVSEALRLRAIKFVSEFPGRRNGFFKNKVLTPFFAQAATLPRSDQDRGGVKLKLFLQYVQLLLRDAGYPTNTDLVSFVIRYLNVIRQYRK